MLTSPNSCKSLNSSLQKGKWIVWYDTWWKEFVHMVLFKFFFKFSVVLHPNWVRSPTSWNLAISTSRNVFEGK
jgi:hypothetical protein